MQEREFNKVYYAVDEYGYIILIFYDNHSSSLLEFNGINFYQKNKFDVPSNFKEVNCISNSTPYKTKIQGVKQSEDISFIKLDNGDIFQLYFMSDDENGQQIMSVFSEKGNSIMTPTGMNSYEAVLKRFQEADEVEIINEVSQ